jgi:hypothetical protein
MSKNIRFEDWEAQQMQDPEFQTDSGTVGKNGRHQATQHCPVGEWEDGAEAFLSAARSRSNGRTAGGADRSTGGYLPARTKAVTQNHRYCSSPCPPGQGLFSSRILGVFLGKRSKLGEWNEPGQRVVDLAHLADGAYLG